MPTHWLRASDLLISPHLLPASQLRQLQHRIKSDPSQEDWFQNPNLVKVRPTISSQYHSISRSSSGSFPFREITFHFNIPCPSWLSFHDSQLQQLGIRLPRPLPLTATYIASDRYGSSCGWWAHMGTDPRLLFRLSPTGPLPQAWLQGRVPVSLQGGYTSPCSSPS